MKKLLLVLCLFLSFTVYSQSYTYARYCLSKLASKELCGRGYVNNGTQKASEFIEGELKLDGFVSGDFSSKDRLVFTEQSFPVSINNIDSMSLRLHKEDTLRTEGIDYLVFGSSPSTYLKVENTKLLVFNDKSKLQESNFKNYDDKILVFNQKLFSYRDIILFIRNLNKSSYTPKLVIIQGYEKIQYPISTSKIKFPVLLLKGEEFVKNKIDYLELSIKSTYYKEYLTKNIWVKISGTENPDSIIMLTSHYDHLGMCGNAIFPGASDNASGTSVNLDLIKYYSTHPQKYTMVFVFCSAEEIGLYGSTFAAQNPLVNLDNVKFLLNLDMCGTGSNGVHIVNATAIPEKAQIFEDINKRTQAFNNIVLGGPSCNSDHCPFAEKGVPAFFLFTSGKEFEEYHTVYDKADNFPFTKHIDFCNLIKEFVEKIQ